MRTEPARKDAALILLALILLVGKGSKSLELACQRLISSTHMQLRFLTMFCFFSNVILK